MVKKSAVARTSKSTRASRSLVKSDSKKTKSSKPSASKVVKTKPVKKTPAKVIKGKTVKKTSKSTPKKSEKTSKTSKVVKTTKVANGTKSPKAAKKKTESSGPKGYTPSEYQKFLSEKKRLEGKTNQELKDELRNNMQSMSGNKDDLIYKVADGIVLGRIPRCPKCFGGRPKFDFKKGTYYCSGYRDDEDFKNCHTTFQLAQIKRQPWQ